MHAPQKLEAHTLDLHVVGQPPLALLAEPAGAPQNGHFPLRLRPLYRAQAAQLYALLAAENVSVDGPPDDTPRSVRPAHPSMVDASPLARGMSGSAPPLAVTTPKGDPRRTAPSATWGLPAAADPRRTVPSGSWSAAHGPAQPQPAHQPPMAPDAPSVIVDEDAGAFDDEPSLSVSVVFEPENMPAVIQAMAQAASTTTPQIGSPLPIPPAPSTTPSAPADLDEPSLSVSVVFEPDALPAHLLAAVPSPLGSETRGQEVSEAAPSTQPGSDVPATVAAPPPVSALPSADAGLDDGFFDDALANFPTATFADEPPSEAATTDSMRPTVESFADVNVDEVELLDGSSGAMDDEGLVAVPPPPDDDDNDNDATLVRLPMSTATPAVVPESIVHPEARNRQELTPTQTITPARKQKSSKRKPNDTAETIPPSAADEDADTAARLQAPVPPVSPPPVVAEEPSSARARHDNDPAIGRRVADGKYIIESLIGSGAAGAVYRATHRELRRTVAIKILHPHYQQDPQFMTSFRGEALAASQLDHPNVMRVLDFDQESDGLIYIVMEYLSGRTLQSLLDEERRLPTERAVEIMIQVCAALSVAHDHGIIHRDIKPDNIMLVPSRNDEGTTFELVKVCDFGIAALQNPRAEDAELAATEHVIAGTPEYMSPEQARGAEVDARSDVYACGICLYELVTGRPPFLGDNPADILIKQLEEIPKPPSQIIKGLDPIIEEVILRAVQKDPAKRHQSAREMRVELKELIEPGDAYSHDDEDELSIVEDVPVLDDPASGFPGFFIAFSSAILRFGRFERGHHEAAQAMKELQKSLRTALRGRSELTFARRDVQKTISYVVMTGTAEIVDLRRLLGSQLYGSFGEPFIAELVKKGIASVTLREGIPDVELHYIVEMLLGPFAGEDLRKELASKPLRHVSLLFVSDVVGRDRKLSWKVGLGASRLARDLRALCNVRGISLKKMRETRDELVGGVARLLTRGDEVKQFIFNADLVDEAVANLRGFS
ncbi:MAG: Serine/threonine protein kinase PrkC, regulator of stationary phase, partial [Labilithrix sp.]|nr:Serine/threonine protein kinase PrkC, regulator of stationary phase [Labilithrix sp.]